MPHPSPPLRGTTFPSRYGLLTLVADETGIRSLDCEMAKDFQKPRNELPDPGRLSPLVRGILMRLEGISNIDLPLAPQGTPFQKKVWDALRRIPRGTVVSYADVARAVGLPSAARAVAQACGANPIIFLIPCHRVVASDGSLGGYGPGLGLKATVLDDEGVRIRKLGNRWRIDSSSWWRQP